jgi:hypothetical protein
MKILLVTICMLFVNVSSAQTYIQINGVSVHDRSGYNGLNYGAGIEQAIAERWTVAGGWYRNSEYRGSAYGYARYSVYKNWPWDIGIGAGVVTGYSSYSMAPMAFPEVCYSYFCAIAIPQVNSTGANALAMHLRIPIY